MDVEHDDFVVTFDAKTIAVNDLLRVSKETGFEAHVVATTQAVSFETSLDDALARARRENKPVVIDFVASWCAPCKRMLKETFPDPSVAPLLQRCVLVKIDTDKQPEIAKRFGVFGLPDIRFLSPAGKEQRKLLDFQPPNQFAVALNELLATPFSLADARLSDLSQGEQLLKETRLRLRWPRYSFPI